MGTQGSNWIISAHRRNAGESLVAEQVLQDVSVEQLRAALGRPHEEDDPDLLFVYPIETPQQSARFERLLGVPLDLGTYKYFLDCFAEERATSGEAEPESPRVRRQVSVFRKEPEDELVFEYELPHPPDARIQLALGSPMDDLGYCTLWRLDTPEVAASLSPLLRMPLDLTAPYDYLLEHWDSSRTSPSVLAFSKQPQDDPRQVVARYELHGVTKESLRTILGLSEDHPMTGRFPVRTEAQAAALTRFLDAPLELTAHEYRVDYYHPRPELPVSP